MRLIALAVAAALTLPAFAGEKPKVQKPAVNAAAQLQEIIDAAKAEKAKFSPFADTKQVVYDYDPNQSFAIVSRTGLYTQIDMPEDEVVQGFYLSDTGEESWKYHVSGDQKHILVQPLRTGLFNSGSIITNRHSYLLAISSGSEGEWYQRVRWNVPSRYRAVEKTGDDNKSGVYEDFEKPEQPASVPAKQKTNYLGKRDNVLTINTAYRIEGNSELKPQAVYDNGTFTWIKLPENSQELPALFAISEKGDPELVNYVVDDTGALKVSRVLQAGLLKLGDREARFFGKNWHKSSWFGSSDGGSGSIWPWSK